MKKIHFISFTNEGRSQIYAIGIYEIKYYREVISIDPNSEEGHLVFCEARERLGDCLNSKFDESTPILSPDGWEVY